MIHLVDRLLLNNPQSNPIRDQAQLCLVGPLTDGTLVCKRDCHFLLEESRHQQVLALLLSVSSTDVALFPARIDCLTSLTFTARFMGRLECHLTMICQLLRVDIVIVLLVPQALQASCFLAAPLLVC
jgi:hypothetical protein